MRARTLKENKVSVITLGCSKNVVDSENLITQLKGNEFEVDHDQVSEDTGVVIINTCGFIDLAKEESINTILKYAKVKSEGGIDKLYVTGCLSQRYKENLEEAIPEVDAYFGKFNWQNILSYNKEFGDHNLGVTLVQEYQKQRSTFFQSQVTNISDLYFQENIVSGTFATPEAFGGISENGLASYLGRVNYNFAGKYYLSGSIRRDELSALAPGNRVGYFPGVSFAYRIS